MINSSEISPKQMVVLKAIKAMFGKSVVSRTELVEYANKNDQVYAPGFIVKNDFYKARDKTGAEIRGMYRIPVTGSSKKKVNNTTKEPTEKPSKKVSKVVGPVVIASDEAQSRASLLEEELPELSMSMGN